MAEGMASTDPTDDEMHDGLRAKIALKHGMPAELVRSRGQEGNFRDGGYEVVEVMPVAACVSWVNDELAKRAKVAAALEVERRRTKGLLAEMTTMARDRDHCDALYEAAMNWFDDDEWQRFEESEEFRTANAVASLDAGEPEPAIDKPIDTPTQCADVKPAVNPAPVEGEPEPSLRDHVAALAGLVGRVRLHYDEGGRGIDVNAEMRRDLDALADAVGELREALRAVPVDREARVKLALDAIHDAPMADGSMPDSTLRQFAEVAVDALSGVEAPSSGLPDEPSQAAIDAAFERLSENLTPDFREGGSAEAVLALVAALKVAYRVDARPDLLSLKAKVVPTPFEPDALPEREDGEPEQRCIAHAAVMVLNGDCPICDVEQAEAERDAALAGAERLERHKDARHRDATAANAEARRLRAELRRIKGESFRVDGALPRSWADDVAELERLRAAVPLSTETLRNPSDELVEAGARAQAKTDHGDDQSWRVLVPATKASLVAVADWLESQSPPSPVGGDARAVADAVLTVDRLYGSQQIGEEAVAAAKRIAEGSPSPAVGLTVKKAQQESIISRIREVARERGYAVAVHGSRKRDLDLIAAPWTVEADDPLTLVDTLCERLSLRPRIGNDGVSNPECKPYGRIGWSLTSEDGPLGCDYIDLSVVPKAGTAFAGELSRLAAVSEVTDTEEGDRGA